MRYVSKLVLPAAAVMLGIAGHAHAGEPCRVIDRSDQTSSTEPGAEVESRTDARSLSSSVTAGNGKVSGATSSGSASSSVAGNGGTTTTTTTTDQNGRRVTIHSSGAGSSASASATGNGVTAGVGVGDCVTVIE